jgi:hypothetical protein
VSDYFCSLAGIHDEGSEASSPLPRHHCRAASRRVAPALAHLHARVLKRAVMTDCKPCSTLVDLKTKLAADSKPPVRDPSQFQSIVGALQYLTFTRPDIAYAVQQVYLHMHDPGSLI